MKNEQGRGRVLEGVKSIAAFVGVSERTVHRWCAERCERGIPIRKIGGRYVAYEQDLEAWATARAA